MCVQFIIVVYYYELILSKFYNNYAIIYVQHSLKPSYIKHYNIIRVLHKQFTSFIIKGVQNNVVMNLIQVTSIIHK